MVAASALSRAASIVKATRKSDSAVVGEYRYDALGRRVEKVVTGATYRYIYSGVETVSVYTSTGTWKQDYVYGENIDEVVMLEQADLLAQDSDSNTSELTRSFYHRNALGSVMEVTDMSQAVAVSYRYDPYGQVTITRGGTTQTGDPLGQHVTYTGRWRDEETGLYHYRARAYDPVRGRFMQRDPLGLSQGENLYRYVRSSPISHADPTGAHDPDDPRFGGEGHDEKLQRALEEEKKREAEQRKLLDDALRDVRDYGPPWAQELLRSHPNPKINIVPKIKGGRPGRTHSHGHREEDGTPHYTHAEIDLDDDLVEDGEMDGATLLEVLLHELRHLKEFYKAAPLADGLDDGMHRRCIPDSDIPDSPAGPPDAPDLFGKRRWRNADAWEAKETLRRKNEAAKKAAAEAAKKAANGGSK